MQLTLGKAANLNLNSPVFLRCNVWNIFVYAEESLFFGHPYLNIFSIWETKNLIKTLVFDAVIEGTPLVQGYLSRDDYYSCYHLFQRAHKAGREVAPNTGTNATKFFTLATKSWKLVSKLATRMFHHNLNKRSGELKRFAKTNPRQTSSLSLFPKCSTCISIDN